MSNSQLHLNTDPRWRKFPGYAFGLPQASMMTVEVFPSHPKAIETTVAFSALIAEVVEDDFNAASAQDGPLAVATALASATAHVQNWAYVPVTTQHVCAKSGEDGVPRVRLVLPTWNPDATHRSYALCADLWNRLAAGEIFEDMIGLRSRLADALSPSVSKSVNQFAHVKGIMALGINLVRLPGAIFCLGTGARARLMNSTVTDRTPGIGLNLARNKFHTASMLRMSGLPGAENEIVPTADDAVRVAARYGLPAVIKPADLDRGDGVAADLNTETSIREAFAQASALTKTVMVEKYIPGFTHRLTVVDDAVISVRQRIPGGVTGNGTSTVAELVDTHQQSAWSQRWKRTRGRFPVTLDSEALELLEQHGLQGEAILPEGQFQRLRRRDNISAGGRNQDVPLDEVHPDNLDLAVSAARVIRLDIAGVDLISRDIARSWRDVGARICEVNGRPQFAARHTPELYHALLSRIVGPDPHVPGDLLLCADDPAERAAVVDTVGKRDPNRTISTCEGLWRKGTSLTGSFSSGYDAALAAAIRSDVVAMTCVMSMREVFQLGSPLLTWSGVHIQTKGFSDEERQLIPNVRAILGGSAEEPPVSQEAVTARG